MILHVIPSDALGEILLRKARGGWPEGRGDGADLCDHLACDRIRRADLNDAISCCSLCAGPRDYLSLLSPEEDSARPPALRPKAFWLMRFAGY